jgi:hypothetical protein
LFARCEQFVTVASLVIAHYLGIVPSVLQAYQYD